MKTIPCFKQLPVIQLWEWTISPLKMLERGRDKYGDCFKLNLGILPPVVILNHPKDIELIFTASSKHFDTGRTNRTLKTIFGANSIFLLDGKEHQQHRQLMMPPFHGERMKAYGNLIVELTDKLTKNWRPGTLFETRSFMAEITLETILSAIFGVKENARYDRLKYLLGEFLDSTGTFFGNLQLFFPILRKDFGPVSFGKMSELRLKEIDELIYEEIRLKRENFDSSATDILSLLISAKDESGVGLSDQELRDELITLLIAGHETSATILSWTLYWIHKLAFVKEKILGELGSMAFNFDPSIINKLPYLNAVILEALRLYPVGFMTLGRFVNVPIEIGGYSVEPGYIIMGSIYLTHHRSEIYPDSKEFKPERFLQRQFSPYEFYPFGGGNRRCIGAAFAMFEMKLILARIMSVFKLELVPQPPVLPQRRGATIAPNRGITMLVN